MQANKTLYSDTNKENINTTMTATAEVKTMNLRIHEQKKELRERIKAQRINSIKQEEKIPAESRQSNCHLNTRGI